MLWAVALDVCDVAPLAGALDEYDEMFRAVPLDVM